MDELYTNTEDIQKGNEALKAQLMNNSLVNELIKVMQSCTDYDKLITTMLLGIKEIANFDRIIMFTVDSDQFELKATSSVGISDEQIENFTIPLGFAGGEITDAVFFNRHILVEDPDTETDPFYKRFSSHSYLTMPIVGKPAHRCWEYHDCTQTTCPVYHSPNPYCWSIPGSTKRLPTSSEDQRRGSCSTCNCFACLGVLWMEKSRPDTTISSEDISLLSSIATQAGIIIDNHLIFHKLEQSNDKLTVTNTKLTQVNKELQEAQAKINADLSHARKVQQGLLPNIESALDYFSIGVQYIPAHAVGGDYYDMFEISPGVYAAVIADVSGHGIASAFIMSMAKVLLKTISYQGLSPQQTLERINNTFLTEVKSDNFITIFYCIIDANEEVMHFNSAGHCPVLLIDKEKKEYKAIEADGTFLGIFDDMMLEQQTHRFSRGKERLLLYTDGLTEAHNVKEEMFTFDRLKQLSLDTLALAAQDAVDRIIDSYRDFRGKELSVQSPQDDVTLLVIDL